MTQYYVVYDRLKEDGETVEKLGVECDSWSEAIEAANEIRCDPYYRRTGNADMIITDIKPKMR